MITSKTYRFRFEEIKNLDFSTYPRLEMDIEKVFSVNLSDRSIIMPSEFSQLGVVGDHKAETVWFVVHRYFDGIDLMDVDKPRQKWAIQATNANQDSFLFPFDCWATGDTISDIKWNKENDYPEISSDEILLGWSIPYEITMYPGTVTFSLRCFELESAQKIDDATGEPATDEEGNYIYEDVLIYSISTEPASATIVDSLNITDESENLIPPANSIESLIERIERVMNADGTVGEYSYSNIKEETLPSLNGQIIKGHLTTESHIKIPYKDLTEKPTITVDGVAYEIGGETPIEVTKITVDSELNQDSINPVQNKVLWAEIDDIKTQLEEASFVPIGITSFLLNDSQEVLFEKGYETKEEDLIFSWVFNKNPNEAKIQETSQNDLEIEIKKEVSLADLLSQTAGTYTWTDPISENRKFILEAKDKRNTSVASTDIIFTNLVYYGAAEAVEVYTQDFVKSLRSKLQTSNKSEITVQSGGSNTDIEAKYVYYITPSEYPEPEFWVGGFSGGLELVASNIEIENQYNLKTNYNIYRSNNNGLGLLTVTITEKKKEEQGDNE